MKPSLAERIVGDLLRLLCRERFEIGRKGVDRYLTRWTLWGKRFGAGHKWFLHLFHRGDVETYPHSHPWFFWSLILWGGYWELTSADSANPAGPTVRTWYGPGRLLKRPATWKHRVELPEGKTCWTLLWCGNKVQSWGFFCPNKGFIPWRVHQQNQDAGLAGCGEETP